MLTFWLKLIDYAYHRDSAFRIVRILNKLVALGHIFLFFFCTLGMLVQQLLLTSCVSQVTVRDDTITYTSKRVF